MSQHPELKQFLTIQEDDARSAIIEKARGIVIDLASGNRVQQARELITTSHRLPLEFVLDHVIKGDPAETAASAACIESLSEQDTFLFIARALEVGTMRQENPLDPNMALRDAVTLTVAAYFI